jgi:hypothetical protein
MRWKSNVTPDPVRSDKRINRKFLLYPRHFNSGTWRWLEYADITERFECYVVGYNRDVWCWREEGFADE